jgi:hypothetical protein
MPKTEYEQGLLVKLNSGTPVVPIDRSKYSEFALDLIEQRGIQDPEDPEAIMIGILDKFRLKILEDISLTQLDKVAPQLREAVAQAGVEFGQIDLAVKALNEFMGKLNTIEKRFTRTTDRVLRQNIASIAINHVMPLIYVIFGIALCFALQKALGRL